MSFRLTITLGNAATECGNDVANALQLAADQIRYTPPEDMRRESGNIRDENGNTVGQWKVTGR